MSQILDYPEIKAMWRVSLGKQECRWGNQDAKEKWRAICEKLLADGYLTHDGHGGYHLSVVGEELIRRLKYAVFMPADQTIVYLTKDGNDTVRHPEAGLWDTWLEAKNALQARGYKYRLDDPLCLDDPYNYVLIEPVQDETEFRAREDTW